MNKDPFPGVVSPENSDSGPQSVKNPISGPSASSDSERPSENSASFSEEQPLDASQRIMKERPFISSRLSMVNDPTPPRGISTFSRFSMGYARHRNRSGFGYGLGMEDELNPNTENPESLGNPEYSTGLEDDPNENRSSESGTSTRSVQGRSRISGVQEEHQDKGMTNPRGFRDANGYVPAGRTSSRFSNGYGKRNDYGENEPYIGNNSDGQQNYSHDGRFSGRPYRKPYGNGDGRRGMEGPTGRYNGRNWRNEGWNESHGEGEHSERGMSHPYRRNTEGYSSFNPAFPEQNSARSHKEPLSLAEELAEEMSRGHKSEGGEEVKAPSLGSLQDATLERLQQLSIKELIAEARRFEIGIPNEKTIEKQEIIFNFIKAKIKLNGLLYGEGTLEILPDGFGFLRSTEYNYLSCPDDIYVSPSQIRRFGLRNGACVSGQIRPPKENERYFALLRVEAINYQAPNEFVHRKFFEELTPVQSTRMLRLESEPAELESRLIDLISPIGFGHRGLIVSPPGIGKTTLLTKIACSALKNYQDLYVFLLLVDKNPAEVAVIKKEAQVQNCEVISSSPEESAIRHIQIADMVLEKAKRMVEFGKNVLILVDSITHLARAWHSEGALNSRFQNEIFHYGPMQPLKNFLGAARAVEEGGSLTILASLSEETEIETDDLISKELKGTGNLEIVLDKRLAEQNVWPAININCSGTRKEEAIRTPEEFRAIEKLRGVLADLNPVTAMEMLMKRLKNTRNNEEFLKSLDVEK